MKERNLWGVWVALTLPPYFNLVSSGEEIIEQNKREGWEHINVLLQFKMQCWFF